MIFKIIGLCVALYVVFAVVAGEVYAKAGVWGRSISRADSPSEYWMTIVIYAGLAVALFTIF